MSNETLIWVAVGVVLLSPTLIDLTRELVKLVENNS